MPYSFLGRLLEMINCVNVTSQYRWLPFLWLNPFDCSCELLFHLAFLRPSRELLEYYRKKIAEFDTEHDEMLQKLDKYKMTYEEQVFFIRLY